jgi:hypothetical protein
MLRNLPAYDMQNVIVISTFILTLTVFITFFVRALRMKKTDAEHLSHLPLQDESDNNTSRHE